MVKVRNWCALATIAASGGGATAQPTFQPVSEKILPAEPILTVRSAMPGSEASGIWARPSNTTCSQTSSEIAIGVVGDAGLGEQRQLLAIEHPRGRIVRIVEEDEAGLRRERRGQRLRGDPPAGRGQADQPRHAAGAQHQRQIGVVERLEQHDLVARRDQGEQARGDRLGRARGDDHLLRIEIEALMARDNDRRPPGAARAGRASADIGSPRRSAPRRPSRRRRRASRNRESPGRD